MTRSRQGKFGGGQTPLGLMRDPNDQGHLILDPETASVIRKIYDLAWLELYTDCYGEVQESTIFCTIHFIREFT